MPNDLPPDYAELHCCSNFSFLRGASHPEELVEAAQALGYSALAITDEASLAGVVRAHKAAAGCGLKLIIGAEFRLADRQQEGLRLLLLAQDRAGYGNLSALITLARRRSRKGEYRLLRSDFETPGLLPGSSGAVPDCLALWVAEPGGSADDGRWLAQRFPARGWVTVGRHCGADDAQRLADLLALARASGLPAVAAGVNGGQEPRKSGAAKKSGTRIAGREPGPAPQGCGLAVGNMLTNEPEKPRALHQAHEAA